MTEDFLPGEVHNCFILREKETVTGGAGQEFDLWMDLTLVLFKSEIDLAEHWIDTGRGLCRHHAEQDENCEENKQTPTSDKGQTQNASVFGRGPQERERNQIDYLN
jgi:hypothetical protein